MASVRFYSDDEEDDVTTESTLSEFKVVGRDSVILAIECCKEMFETDSDVSPPFNRTISAIQEMMLNKIITSDKDFHGVIFYGTEKSKNPGDFTRIYEWLPFDVPSINTIVNLRAMEEYNFKKFSDEFGFNRNYEVSDVLWACLNMFGGSTYSLATKTLLLFPWNDNPHGGDNNARRRAKAKATDLLEHKVEVHVLSFNQHFKYDPFYKDIVFDPENPEPSYDNPIDCIQNLYSFLLRKCTKQRPLTRIPLKLGDDLALSVGVYTVARRAQKSDYVSIDTATNEEVLRKSNMIDKNTGEILMPSDIKFLQKWGGRDLVFEKEEVQKIRKIAKRGLLLVGFQSKSKAIKAWYHVRNAQFIYPDEKTTKGSTTLFHALLKKCLEKDVVAICNYAPRDTSPPRYVALLPQDEDVDEETAEQLTSPGFYIIFLPYADDIRKLDIPRDVPEPSSAQVEAAEAMIRRLKFSYDPENIDNPVIQTHYKNLEAMALEKADIEPIQDHTRPDYEMIEKKAGSQIRAFKELAFPLGFSKKRGAGDRTADAGAKRAKEEGVEIDVKEYIAQDKLGKLTVAALKDICRSYNIKCTGKKADIINTIEEYFKKKL